MRACLRGYRLGRRVWGSAHVGGVGGMEGERVGTVPRSSPTGLAMLTGACTLVVCIECGALHSMEEQVGELR